jgi:hypothetical protein
MTVTVAVATLQAFRSLATSVYVPGLTEIGIIAVKLPLGSEVAADANVEIGVVPERPNVNVIGEFGKKPPVPEMFRVLDIPAVNAGPRGPRVRPDPDGAALTVGVAATVNGIGYLKPPAGVTG